VSEPADLPAWSLPAGAGERISIGVDWPEQVTRDWAFGEATGKGVRVCILDSGIEAGHPQVGSVEGAVAFHRGQDEEIERVDDTEGDLCGHGTACAGSSAASLPNATSTAPASSEPASGQWPGPAPGPALG
jgi:subtilisin family serine protease